MENLFKRGEVVYERTHPAQKLVVTRYERGLYYGRAQEHKNQRELVFFERELKTNAHPANP
jgi:hypothetical protein